MKHFFPAVLILVLFSSDALCQDVRWPRQLTYEGSVLVMYQPQVDSWDQYKKLAYRLAFTLKPFQGKEVVGVLYMKADTDVNMDDHQVTVKNIAISETHFPSLDVDEANKMGMVVRTFLNPDLTQVMSLEQIVACTPKKDSISGIEVNNDPPVIFSSKRPTILLQMDGPPAKAAAGAENLEYVINASAPLFFDKTSSTFYLYDGLEWQRSPETDGPWTFTKTLPASLTTLAKDSNWASLKTMIPATATADKKMPQIFYSEKLAELILFQGEPAYKSIKGTSLKYATNTNSDIFFCSDDKQYYFVTSGRWFRSSTLNGPWTFATPDLPADFAKIPDSSPASAILAFVPGTEQAKDAVMIAQIPTTIEVNAKEAAKQVNINYSGEPQFKPIDSTNLSYAVNTSEKVIKVSNSEYYACVQGIWFLSSTPTGPWETAASVPPVIYSMPASSPVYNVTYVTQNITTTGTVQSSYTSGYMGVFVVGMTAGVIIASGTGYYHPPYYYYPPFGYPMYYPYPCTYGMYAYHPYYYGGVAYHASYNPHTGMYARSATAYGPYGSRTVAQGYNPSTGTYARGASVSTPYGRSSVAQAYNPYTGTSASTRQNASPYAQWGSSTVSRDGQTVRTGHITTGNGTIGGIKTSNGDMYVGGNGQVYKNTGNGWENASGAQPKTTSSPKAGTSNVPGATQNGTAVNRGGNAAQQPAARDNMASGRNNADMQNLNRDYQNRQRGNMQTQQFNNKSAASNRSMQPRTGGGRMGGGRRR